MRATVPVVRSTVLLLAFTFASFISKAQSISTANGKFEIGAGIGPLFFLGDLGGNRGVGTTLVKDVNFPVTKMAKGLFINYYPTEWLGFRIAANQGTLEGADSLVKDKGGDEVTRKVRNLHFRSNLVEAYGAIEFYPTVFFEQYDGLKGKIRPYGVIGLGMFKFNPQAEYYSNGSTRWVDLQPLHTEGQGFAEYPDRKNYKLTQMEVPLGGGIKWYVKENMFLGFEIMHRKTFTDYIDDVSTKYINPDLFDKYLSPQQATVAKQVYYRGGGPTNVSYPTIGEQRGNPKNNDSFFSSIIRFGWRLFDNSEAEHMGCPKW